MAELCIAENSGGKGGVGGGAGASGQASQNATGAAAHDYGYPVIETVTGMTSTFDVQLTKDYNGELPSDLSKVSEVWFVARPTMVHSPGGREIKVPCTFTADGKVSFKLTPKEVDYNNGVWYAEFLCYEAAKDAEGVETKVLTHDYRAYLCIRKGTQGSNCNVHTVTALDIRLALMDTSPEMNSMLDDLEFSDMMIMHAVERAIDEWEETPPVLDRHFDATNFPYREHLIKGAIGYLLQMVMYRYMRNRMQYSAAGLTLDKNDKGGVYQQMAQMARMEWKNFIGAAKTSLNMEECLGVINQPWFDGEGCF